MGDLAAGLAWSEKCGRWQTRQSGSEGKVKLWTAEVWRNGFSFAALLTFVLMWLQFGAFGRRSLEYSQAYPVELSNHGDLFFVSQSEAWGLFGLLGLAAAFFGVAALIEYRVIRKSAQVCQLRTRLEP